MVALGQNDSRSAATLAFERYLQTDCELPGDSGESLRGVLRFAPALELDLILLLRDGPGPRELARVESLSQAEWVKREEYLRGGSQAARRLLDQGLAQRVPLQEYRDFESQRYTQQVREKAAIALAAIGTPQALEAVRQAAEGGNEGLRAVIAAALARFRR